LKFQYISLDKPVGTDCGRFLYRGCSDHVFLRAFLWRGCGLDTPVSLKWISRVLRARSQQSSRQCGRKRIKKPSCCWWMTGKPEVMPPGWQIAPDKRACIEWPSQLPGGRLLGN